MSHLELRTLERGDAMMGCGMWKRSNIDANDYPTAKYIHINSNYGEFVQIFISDSNLMTRLIKYFE